MTDPASAFADDVYELLKAYRTLPDTGTWVAAGILTPRETWLLDRLTEAFRKHGCAYTVERDPR